MAWQLLVLAARLSLRSKHWYPLDMLVVNSCLGLNLLRQEDKLTWVFQDQAKTMS